MIEMKRATIQRDNQQIQEKLLLFAPLHRPSLSASYTQLVYFLNDPNMAFYVPIWVVVNVTRGQYTAVTIGLSAIYASRKLYVHASICKGASNGA